MYFPISSLHFHTNKQKKLHSFHFPRPRKFFYSFSSSQIPTPTDLHARIDFTCLPQLHTSILSPHPTTPTLSCKPADVLLRFYVMSACTHGKQADDAKKIMFSSLQTQMKHILVLESLTQMNFQHNCRPEFSRLCAGKKVKRMESSMKIKKK